MKLGMISDIHGNLHALDAVLADGHALGVDRWWALGDLVAIGPEPIAVLERLAELPDLEVTRGNTERYALTNDRPPPYAADVLADPGLFDNYTGVARSFAWTGGALTAHGWRDWVAALPLEVRTTLPDGTRVLGVHATPGNDDGYGITPHRPEDELAEAFSGAEADIVCAGHTHQPTNRMIGDVRAVNLGSVSNPVTDDLRASYVIVHGDDASHRVEHRRVAYDRDAFLAVVAASGHPEADFIASFQRGEQFRHPSIRPGAPKPTD
jgi:predicted phosphodiesterase